MNEQWLPVPGYEDLYEVSNLGRVRTLVKRMKYKAGMILQGGTEQNGYKQIYLTDHAGKRKTHMAHRLVAAAFIGELPPGHEVNHINHIRHDNRAENLEYVTHAKNVNLSFEKTDRRFRVPRGESAGTAKLTAEKVRDIRALYFENGKTQREIAKAYKVSHVAIGHIVRGATWTHI